MNIHDRITELEAHIAEVGEKYHARCVPWNAATGTGESPSELNKRLGREWREECREQQRELDALKSPIVSMLVHEGRILVATGGGVFELKGDKLVWVPLQVSTEKQ